MNRTVKWFEFKAAYAITIKSGTGLGSNASY